MTTIHRFFIDTFQLNLLLMPSSKICEIDAYIFLIELIYAKFDFMNCLFFRSSNFLIFSKSSKATLRWLNGQIFKNRNLFSLKTIYLEIEIEIEKA